VKLRKKAQPAPKKGYLMRLDEPAGPCSCRWEPLGFDPVSFANDVLFVREGESLPAVAAGHIRYCPQHN